MKRLPVIERTLPRTPWITLPAGTIGLALLGAIILLTGATSDTGSSPVLEPSIVASEGEEDSDDEGDAGAGAEETPIAIPLVAYELFLSRDPFEPVVEADEPASPVDENGDGIDPDDPDSDPDGSPAGPSGTTGTQTDPDQGGSGSATDGTQTGKCQGEAEVVCDGTLLVLEDLRTVDGEEIAVIVVDDVTYQVRAGERFAESFELLRIDIDSVRLLYGDEVFSLPLLSSVMK